MIPLFLLMGNVVILDLGHDSNRETFIVRLFTSPGQLRHEGSPKDAMTLSLNAETGQTLPILNTIKNH